MTTSQLQKAAAAANLWAFLQYVGPRFARAWNAPHVRLLCEKLMAVERGELTRLMIFLPPRHRKSQLANAHFSAWYLGRNPDHSIITASYGASLAVKFSRQSRNLLREYGPDLFGISVAQDSKAADAWGIEDHYGGLTSAGVGGPLTGKGCNILVVDDPHKDRAEANSATIRETVWDWYTNVAVTRLEPQGAIILIQTRWHEDDLAGRLLQAMRNDAGDQWEIVNLPAFAEEDDLLGRAPGEALWPDEFDEDILDATRRRIGSRAFAALYQQRPQELEGGAFKAAWFSWYTSKDVRLDPDTDTWTFRGQPLMIYQGIDLATTEKTASDEFALVTIGVTPTQDVVVLDILAKQIDPGEQARVIAEAYQDWLPLKVVIEDNGGQKYLVSEVKRWHLQHPEDPRIPVKAVTNTQDKYARITRLAPFVEDGGLYLRAAIPTEEGWTDLDRLPAVRIHHRMVKLYNQLVTFAPKMAHEDVADALDLACSVTRVRRWFDDSPAGRPE